MRCQSSPPSSETPVSSTVSRILMMHWNQAEAEERAERLRAAGHEVEAYWHTDGARAKEVRANPPDVFVIDLCRLPSHGRNSAIWLRQQKSTRLVPIVFVGGQPEKVARAREILPDATFTEWRLIRSAVRTATRRPNPSPVVPRTPGFYAKTSLQKKLGIGENAVIALLGAPKGFDDTLGGLPPGVRVKRRAVGTADMVVLFVRGQRELEKRFAAAVRAMADGGSTWFVWPKKASAIHCDLTQARVREYGLTRGLVDYKVASIDDTWTGLRFARRRRGG